MSNKILQVKELTCIRNNKPLFVELSFQLEQGQVLLIEGPNGSGKSSLLRMLTGLSSPATGDIFWEDQSIYQLNSEYHQHLHYIAHTNGIKLGLTVLENLKLLQHLSSSNANLQSLLISLQLNNHQHMQARCLSAGQRRRLALAKLFLSSKTIWLLDEPLTALDVNSQALFLQALKAHVGNGGIALISSHQHLNIQDLFIQTLRLPLC